VSSKPPFISFISPLIIYRTLASVLLDKINHNKLNHVMTHSPNFQTYALPKFRADPFYEEEPLTPPGMGESAHRVSLVSEQWTALQMMRLPPTTSWK
jgi:hypothetical protein